VLTLSLYLFDKNCGIVYILFFRYNGIKKTATIISVAAAIHSYVEIARPKAKPDPDIPIKCSADIFEAMSEAPMAHQVNEPSARKKSLESAVADFFLWYI
jgi:hypothetical protein